MAQIVTSDPPDGEKTLVPVAVFPATGKKRARPIGLRHIMISLIYFALVFESVRKFNETGDVLQAVLLAVLIGLGLCGVGLWTALRWTRASFVGWIGFVLGAFVILAATTSPIPPAPEPFLELVGSMAQSSYLSWILLPLLIGSIIYLNHQRRSNDQDALLWVLTVAADRQMPLTPGVSAFADQVGGMFRVWVESLRDLLRGGSPLAEALESLPKLVPRGALLLIRIGSNSGSLIAGLREASLARTRQTPILRSYGSRIAYLCWALVLGQLIVGFGLYYIVPHFETIYKDFGTTLPASTQFLIDASYFIVDYAWFFILIETVFLSYLPIALNGWGNLSVPIIDRLFVRRHTILILRALAVVVETGRPIGPALQMLGESYPTRWVRKKLEHASQYASQGIGWTESLRAFGLLSASNVGVLAAAQRAGNLGWALREMAETGERRWGYRLQVWSQVLFLLAMLMLGGIVGLIGVAYFLPLTTLISRLAE